MNTSGGLFLRDNSLTKDAKSAFLIHYYEAMSSGFDGKDLLFLPYFLIFCIESQFIQFSLISDCLTFVGKNSHEQRVNTGLDRVLRNILLIFVLSH